MIRYSIEDQCLGDRHNGGQSVLLNKDGHIEKPRPCLGEWFFLSGNSPLRNLSEVASAFSYFPKLEFYGGDLSRIGTVSFLNVDSNFLFANYSIKASEAVGNILAISQWFGLSDLHYENIKCGTDNNGDFILAPVDIECLFQEIKLPFQTGLIQKDCSDKVFGLKKLINSKVLMPAQVVAAYLRTMRILFSAQEKILKVINEVFASTDISRVILQDTKNYRKWNKNISLPLGFCIEEIVQLEIGDIPYFFREMGSRKINYWSQNGQMSGCSSANTFPKLSQIVLTDLNIYWEKLEKYLKHSSLQIADRLLRDVQLFHEQLSDLEIKKKDGQIEVVNSVWRAMCVL